MRCMYTTIIFYALDFNSEPKLFRYAVDEIYKCVPGIIEYKKGHKRRLHGYAANCWPYESCHRTIGLESV